MISIQYTNNHSAHNDIVVEVNGTHFVCDSYYFVIDPGVSETPLTDGVPTALLHLLEQWIEILQSNENEIIYLPFDFSDQYTRCLQCRIENDTVELSAGSSSIEGWTFLPSNIQPYIRNVTDFMPESPEIRISRAELLDQIIKSMKTIRATP